MKLEKFDRTNVRTRLNRPFIGVDKKGVLLISVGTADMMGIKDGGHVVFHQDKERKEDWYVEKVESVYGFRVRKSKSSTSLLVNAAAIQQMITEQFDIKFNSASVRIPVGTQPVEGKYYPLITAALKR